MKLSIDQLWLGLSEIKDPELPAVSLVEMGIIREVKYGGQLTDDAVTVTMTPTFSGCPALLVMEDLIVQKMAELGFDECHVHKQMNPPWTSDWITDEGRRKLKEFGIVPPQQHGGKIEILLYDNMDDLSISCPYCDSTNTERKNEFGPTLCKSIWYCNACQQPFEQFKAL